MTSRLTGLRQQPLDFVAPILTLALTLAVALVHLLLNPRFFYWDDMQHAIMPIFRTIGLRLLDADWPSISLLTWHSGNLVGEGQYQLFNPVSLALFPLLASMDDLALGSAIYSTTYLLIAAAGGHFLAVRLRVPALSCSAVGLAYATSPFMLYWLAGSWTTALPSMAFLPWALGVLVGPRVSVQSLVALASLSFLIAASGWIHGLLSFLLLAGLALWHGRQSRDPRASLALLAAIGAGGLLAGPQLVAIVDAVLVGTRSSTVSSLGVLTLEPQALLAGSVLPPYFGRLVWGSDQFPIPPVAYCAWFAIPAVAIAVHRRTLTGEATWLLTAAAVLALLMLGPGQVGPVRWPLRFIPAFCLALAAWAAVSLKGQEVREPGVLKRCLLIIAAVAFLCWQRGPEWWLDIAFWSILAAAACYGVARDIPWSRKSGRPLPAGALVLLPTAVVPFVFAAFWPATANLPDWSGPAFPHELHRSPVAGLGSTLQVYSYSTDIFGKPDPQEMRYLPSGNMSMLTGQRYVNGYSPIGRAGISNLLCASRGSFGWTCGAPVRQLFRPVAGTESLLVDLMGIDAIKVQRSESLAVQRLASAAGWHLAEQTDYGSTYVRDEPQPRPGTLSFLGGSAVHHDLEMVGDDEEVHRLQLGGNANDSLVVFARAWYPGYAAEWNDERLDVFPLEDLLVAVRLPAGATEGRLRLWHSPLNNGWATVSLAAGFLMLVLSVLLLGTRRLP